MSGPLSTFVDACSTDVPIRNTFIHFRDGAPCRRSLRLSKSEPEPDAPYSISEMPVFAGARAKTLPELSSIEDMDSTSLSDTATPMLSPRSISCSDTWSTPATPERTPRDEYLHPGTPELTLRNEYMHPATPELTPRDEYLHPASPELNSSDECMPGSWMNPQWQESTPPARHDSFEFAPLWTPQQVSQCRTPSIMYADRNPVMICTDTGFLFSFTLRLADDVGLGIQVAPTAHIGEDDVIEVCDLLGTGAVVSWNRQCAEDLFGARYAKALIPGDRIVRVNAADNYSDMCRECKSKRLLKFFVVRGNIKYKDVLSWADGTFDVNALVEILSTSEPLKHNFMSSHGCGVPNEL